MTSASITATPQRAVRVGLEIGGTFTDIVWIDASGDLHMAKIPSKRDALHKSIAEAINQLPSDLGAVDVFVHGSTVATNAVLERKGGTVGLITTAGFRDVLEIGTHDRVGDPYNLFYQKRTAIVPRRLVAEVAERIRGNGEVECPIDMDGALLAVDRLVKDGINALAISFLNSYVNDSHERALAARVRERYPELPVSIGSAVSPEFREYQRTTTVVINALVSPPVTDYMAGLEGALEARGFTGNLRIVQSTGGVIDVASAIELPVRLLLSGPAAGVRAAQYFAARNGIESIITFDMGGTSTDVAIAENGRPRTVSELTIDGIPVRTAAIDIATVGAGGGSVARIDANGLLTVGPESAGADPGPACFSRGGKIPTVTDAQVVTGILRGDRLLGGSMRIDTDAANMAIAGLGIDGSPASVADAILQIAVSRMASAVRLVTMARGADPADYTLVCYGGGGPIHAAHVAEEVGIGKVLIPYSPGVASALGLLVSEFVVDSVRPVMTRLDDETLGETALQAIRSEVRSIADKHQLSMVSYEIGLDLRYAGQAYEITIWFGGNARPASTIAEAFHATHASRYGYRRDNTSIFVANRRLRVTDPLSRAIDPALTVIRRSASEICRRRVHISSKEMEATFLERGALAVGDRLAGPAVIEETTSTILVPPGWQAEVLATGDILMVRRK